MPGCFRARGPGIASVRKLLCDVVFDAIPGGGAISVVREGVGLGSVIAVVCSWQRNRSILWAILAGPLSRLTVASAPLGEADRPRLPRAIRVPRERPPRAAPRRKAGGRRPRVSAAVVSGRRVAAGLPG
ncbi:MAG: hypothetical protein EBZ59_09355 [Planctomycetia bacterium]|nr:hypothetical protein [Planctomycetia bacterium]